MSKINESTDDTLGITTRWSKEQPLKVDIKDNNIIAKIDIESLDKKNTNKNLSN